MTADTACFEPSRFLSIGPSRRWTGSWIWSHEPGPQNTYWLFRRAFDVETLPASATLFASAETRCQLFLNGASIGRAPKPSQPWLQYYHAFDVAAHLKPGPNVLAAIVYVQGAREFCDPGLLVEIEADGSCLVGTDETWAVQRGHAWREHTQQFGMNHFARFQEHVDLRRMPQGWLESDFDDATWTRAVFVPAKRAADGGRPRIPNAGPWSRLIPNPLPPMTDDPVYAVAIQRVEECVDLVNRQRSEDCSISLSQPGQDIEHATLENPEALLQADDVTTLKCSEPVGATRYLGRWDPAIVLDFGTIVTAYPRLTLEVPEGATLEIGYAERLFDGHFNNALEGWFADTVTFPAGTHTWQPFTWKAFRYLKLRLKHASTQPVRIRDLHARISTYPFEPRGHFECPDADLQGAWEISRETLRLCSNEFLMDTPWREAAQWLGDVASVTLGGIHACFGDTMLPREFYRQTAANQFPTGMISNTSNFPSSALYGAIPDYSLEWLIFLWDHFMLTGDEVFLEECYPVALRVIQALLPHSNAHGQVEDVPYWHLIDWAHLDRRGAGCAFNALFYGALEALGNIATQLGDSRWARKTDALRAILQAHFQQDLWDARHGCFADCRVDGVLSERHSEHASLAAIRFGLADEDATAEVLQRFYETPRGPEDTHPNTAECAPFFTVFELQAQDRVGGIGQAQQVIRAPWGR
ncbi:MAG: family 78 glycoside hydrolase catalytic domain, partial [Opitutales bacterium]